MQERSVTHQPEKTTPQKELADDQIRHKIMFYALMDAAMSHFERFADEEIEVYASTLKRGVDAALGRKEVKERKKLMVKWISDKKKQTDNFRQRNKVYLERMVDDLQQSEKAIYDNFANLFNQAAPRLYGCEKKAELLTFLDMFNNGSFDDAIKELEKKSE